MQVETSIESENAEIFEISDFTTASDWERFVSDLEDILKHWTSQSHKPESDYSQTHAWSQKIESLKFAKVNFTVSFFTSKLRKSIYKSEEHSNVIKELTDISHDFSSDSHYIARWFGVNQFIVLSPVDKNDQIGTDDKAKLLLSSAAIAMTNTNCSIPIFVQLNQAARKFVAGIVESHGIRVNFDMVHFREIDSKFHYLSELTKIFINKLQSPEINPPPIKVSARITYMIDTWPQEWCLCDPDLLELDTFKCHDIDYFQNLLFHFLEKPIKELHLSSIWPSISENMVNDTPHHTNLDSQTASLWSIRVIYNNNATNTLTQSLANLFQNLNLNTSFQILGRAISAPDDKVKHMEPKTALDKIAGLSINDSLTLPQFKAYTKWCLPDDLKKKFFSFIFDQSPPVVNEPSPNDFKDFRYYKSAPYMSITWKLALVICHINYIVKDVASLAYFWREFISELSNYWESVSTIPTLDNSPPNLGACLLHQKLQMLNCCIHQKQRRELIQAKQELKLKVDESEEEEDDDEFYDCIDEDTLTEKSSKEFEGRLHQLNDLKLLNRNQPLYVPITQEPTPMTEDMLAEQAQVLSQLGSGAEGTTLRARMQSASLVSDMEAFKAANPGATLEDFVRWHSPKDFIEETVTGEDGKEVKRGKLSVRMQTPGNTWKEVWQISLPKPVYKQKRLFDYTKEAEKVLHYLSTLDVNTLIQNIAPILIQCATCQLMEISNTYGCNDGDFLMNLSEIGRYCSYNDHEACLRILQNIEYQLTKIESLKSLLVIAHEAENENKPFEVNEVKELLVKLAEEEEITIDKPGSSVFGKLIKRLFIQHKRACYEERTSVGERVPDKYPLKLPDPVAKEYILRANCPRPAIYSQSLPQRMYVLISSGDYRIAGAFSTDTIFS